VPVSNGKDQTASPASGEATQYLARIEAGDAAAAQMLLPLVYDQLRDVAGAIFFGQPASHTLQPTALVHEAYLKLIGSNSNWNDSAHFCAVAATAMRQILSNHARAKRAAKRDAHRVELTVDAMPTPTGPSTLDLLDLDDALNELSQLNARHSRMIELRFLGGLTVEAMADILGISAGMARREWRAARAWLSCRLSLGEAP
jgi:RNA polymerase sigma factor (TIGR02999 family)